MAKVQKAASRSGTGAILKSVQDAKQAATLHQSGAYAEAAELYARILKRDPRNAQTRHMQALCFIRLGRLPEAVSALRTAASQSPKDANILASLGEALMKTGEIAEAKAAFERACAIEPEHRAARRALARIVGSAPDGVATLRQWVEAHPGDGNAILALGRAMIVAGEKPSLAIEEWLAAEKRGALKVQNIIEEADHAYNNDRPEEALALFRAAAVLSPGYAAVHCNIGALLMENDLQGSLRALQTALTLKPDNVSALLNMASLYSRLGRHSEALDCYLRTLTLTPDSIPAHVGAIDMSHHICEWGNLAKWEKEITRLLAGDELINVDPFVLLSCEVTRHDLLRAARGCSTTRVARGTPLPPPPAGDPNRRIRIGYLSSDLHAHATAYLTAGMFERHDREKFETFAYSHGIDDGSETRKRMEKAFDHFIDIRTLTDREAAVRMREDGIDILVDLKGFTGGCRTAILALRPAPVQVNFVGFPGSMGADFIDYLVADRIIIPPEAESDYDEKIVLLPDCYQPNDSTRAVPSAVPSRAECGLPQDGFVFCCFNNTYKITPEIFDVWMRLLDQVPGSVLWLFEANRTVRDNLAYETAARGVDPERLVFAPFIKGQDKHIARYMQADLFLDTRPVNAHTTASDALWAGVPVVTYPGETFASRVAASLVSAVGLPELAVSSFEAYEALALSIARDPARLAALKAHLAAARTSSPLFDTATFTRNIEAAFTRMHALRCAGKKPERIVI